MTAFRPKRVSGSDLVAQLQPATANLPPSLPQPPRDPAGRSPAGPERGRPRPPPVVQVNFKASEAFADLLAREAEKAGSLRRLLARILRDAGYDVPDADVHPPDNRRRRAQGS